MMTHQDDLESYEATEAQDLTRLLQALRPPERAVQVPPPVDLTIRAAIWQAPVRRQVSTLLSLARQDLIQVIRQALTDNPLLEEVAPAEDEHTPCLTVVADDLMDATERYDSIWQACMSDGWDASGLPAQASGASEHPSSPHEAPVPDVIVTQVGQEYQVVFNEAGMPRLRLRAIDRHLVREGHVGAPEATQDLDDQLRAAVWLIRSLEHRRQTLYKLATSLVKFQHEFLDHGLAHLKPLVLKDVAEDIGVHESTVSRVTTNTYLYTAQGLFELRSFFHSDLESFGGETMSSRTVKDRIKKLVAGEDPVKPLTDQQLVEVLAAEQVKIARRTVTQYRRELRLPPANRRRHLSNVAEAGTHPQPAWPPGVRLSPDEERQLRQILEAPASLPDYQTWLQSRQIVPDPVGEMRQAYRDLQTALAHPQLRPAVLLALRAFAQAAEASVTTPPPAGAAEPGPRLTEPPPLGKREEASGVPPAVEAAQRHRDLAWLEQTRKSPKMQEVSRLVERARHTTATVLLTGERGAGKSHMARLLHDQGPRAQGPWIAVNCVALPEPRLEAELFGDEYGAFTGATPHQPGCLELAAGGTLFLKEIDALSPVLQAKLLRVLQDRQFERVGGTATLTTDARIVAATTQHLDQLVAEGQFRRDLFYRLNVYPIALPPLRERQKDLGPLTMFFLMRCSQQLLKEVRGISKEAMGWLERHPWPGNVRELAEVIEQAIARCQGPTVTPQDLPQALREQSKIMS